MVYEKLWNNLKNRLSDMERFGNMLQQSMGYALLEMMKEMERGAKNTEQADQPDSSE